MSGDPKEIVVSATRLFDGWEGTDERTGWDPNLWEELEHAGLTLISVAEESGGAGGTLGDAAAVLRLAGRYAVPAPLAETNLLAGWALSVSDLAVPEGPLTAAPSRTGEYIEARREGGGWSLYGRLRRVPAVRVAGSLALIVRAGRDAMVAMVDTNACEVLPGENLAGEVRDDVVLDGVRLADAEVAPAGRGVDEETLRLRGALARSVMMTGALERVLELSVRHASERRQFGRPIGRFQAIQQQLATLAGEAAAASAAAEAAVAAADGSGGDVSGASFEIAVAKARVGEAAGTSAAIAHQVHGAIGFTERHPLRHSTRRLWAWRDEFGAESEWTARLGEFVAGGGPEALWTTLTGSPSAVR